LLRERDVEPGERIRCARVIVLPSGRQGDLAEVIACYLEKLNANLVYGVEEIAALRTELAKTKNNKRKGGKRT